jgi:8-oxo-dGTP pyrophosphatase MutT (NUDIX family)
MTFASQLQNELKNLPGEAAHVEMFPLRARTSEALKTVEGYRLSAVMALLYPEGASHNIILIERQDYDGKHSGQMSFPGGKKEDEDYSSLEAALRETHEEIGIHPDQIKVLGKLSDVYIPVSGFLVHPYVGMLESKPEFIPDTREVKSVFTFDINEILRESNRVITTVSVGKGATMKDVPAFQINDKIIWGATALMLNELRIILKRLI